MTTEKEIEPRLIEKLADLKYTYRPDIRDKDALEQNFRKKFEALNRVSLSDAEFARLRDEIVSPDVFTASKTLRERNTFLREDGTPLQYTLVHVKDWCKNDFEVIHQLRINTANSHHRYDVILLLNGVPVVQIELKTLDVSPRRAMQQIVDYKNAAGNGYASSLLCFVQLFVASNGSNTFYFANNNAKHFLFDASEQFLPVYQFAGVDNKKITRLSDFADHFLAKCLLAEMISRYMVLVASEQKLLVMRPYQIYAVKAIVDCIHQNRGNGYVWHTTGSGKTLTSFKASTLLKDNPDIEKCLFVVDRKDLDRQTREEFNKFQAGCVEENTNTEALVRRMLSEDYADKVIVTTIQKLGLALDENSARNKKQNEKGKPSFKTLLEPLKPKRIVFIFDECHRSQFGENHQAIKAFFPNAQLFGFTGTPIFEKNATYAKASGDQAFHVTTQDVFQKQLHSYTITHAIEDQNVLKFHVDYFKGKQALKPGEPSTRRAIVEAILRQHDGATHQRRFNAILATASINDAIDYYQLFKEIQPAWKASHDDFSPLHVACVFSPPAEGNKDVQQIQEDLPQEKADNLVAPQEKKNALKTILADYNRQYGTNHRIDEFDLYYQDVQKRIKDHKYPNAEYPRQHKIDVTIVVDMLLTGFDSKYLNTLYVDKNLKHHGLIQAFSRTNRILNGTKRHGNILDFREQQNEVDAAIALFSGEKAEEAKEIWLVEPAPKVIEHYAAAVAKMGAFMSAKNLASEPEGVYNLKGDAARLTFIQLFKEVQGLKIQLDQYTDLSEDQKESIEALLPKDQLRSFKSSYLELVQQIKKNQQSPAGPAATEAQNTDLELVLFASALIDYDYIMGLIAKSMGKATKQKMTRDEIIQMIKSEAGLLDRQEDLEAYVKSLDFSKGLSVQAVREGFLAFVAQRNLQELAAVARKHGLEPAALQAFTDSVLRRLIFDGSQLSDLLAPLELGWKARTQKELALMEDLTPLLKKRAQGQEISGLSAYE